MTVTYHETSRAAALEALRMASRALARHLDTEAELADLALVDAALARLVAQSAPVGFGMREFDQGRLVHLLQLTGPVVALELLARLTEDLETTREGLNLGAADEDWKRLRENSHVLISLAGSVGALSLQDQAERLNAISHSEDSTVLKELMPPLVQELVALIAVVRATAAARGSA